MHSRFLSEGKSAITAHAVFDGSDGLTIGVKGEFGLDTSAAPPLPMG
jgi:hypothetical protein